jgi:hypothetical protein
MNDDIRMEPISNLDTSVFEQVIDHGPIEDRLELARQLCGLVNSEDTPLADLRAVMPCLARLACDRDRDVREILARELLANASLGADVVFAIVADDDDLALPFIKANPSFNCQVQCAVLQVGDQKRCSALASRADISPAAVRRIVNDGLAETAIALLNNEHVRLGAGYCRKLYNRFHDQPKVCAVLMEVPYLPPEIALVHNQRTADEMRRTAKLQGWVADFRSDDYISDNEELNALRILDRFGRQAPNIVALMSTRGMLTTSLLLRAGIQGKMPFLSWRWPTLQTCRCAASGWPRQSHRKGWPTSSCAVPAFPKTHTRYSAPSACWHRQPVGRQDRGCRCVWPGAGRTHAHPHCREDPEERQRAVQLLSQLSQGRTQTLVSA